LVKCIDCGFCGFYVDLLRGLHWYEMNRATRRAFRLNEASNPPGQKPGTGHWHYATCSKYLQEWDDWDDGVPSKGLLRNTILKKRDCNGFTEYKPGLTPQEHLSFDQPDASNTQEKLEYDVFLSHSSEDDELALRIKQLLEASGIRMFATPSSIPSGLWNPKIEIALQRSQHLWLLLTPKALERSIWSHQEFGYFYGHKKALNLDDEDQRLHYFEVEGNSSRPGMYAHFQATPVPSFDDPASLARIIARSLGRSFNELEDPTSNSIDAEGKFIWSEGEAVCNFGKKHMGRKLKDIAVEDPDYLEWVASADFSPEVKEMASKALNGEFPEAPPQSAEDEDREA